MLMMKKEFFDAIRGGAKRTTLRYWRHRRVRVGSVHAVRGLGAVRIDAVETVKWDDLTEADARADGFESLDALHEALAAMYPPDRRDGQHLFLVRFTPVRLDGCDGRLPRHA